MTKAFNQHKKTPLMKIDEQTTLFIPNVRASNEPAIFTLEQRDDGKMILSDKGRWYGELRATQEHLPVFPCHEHREKISEVFEKYPLTVETIIPHDADAFVVESIAFTDHQVEEVCSQLERLCQEIYKIVGD